MTYATLMVHLELGRSNAALLNVASALAQRFGAGVIGIAACQPMPMVFADGAVDGSLVEQNRIELDREMQEAEAALRQALQAQGGLLGWRASIEFLPLADHIAREARAADLLVTGVATGDLFDASRAVNTGDLVMQAGRPVLVVPAMATAPLLKQIVVAWKDTRESRRAVADALPLLKQAARVTVVEIAAAAEMTEAAARCHDVVAWLEHHGVAAQAATAPATVDDAAALYAFVQDQGADLLVAGAYGHSRLREWAFGGVTRDLLLRTDCCVLLSH